MNKEQAIEKVNELLSEDVTQEFEEQEEHTANTGKNDFLVSNSKNLTVQVEMDYDEENDEVIYSINEIEWAK